METLTRYPGSCRPPGPTAGLPSGPLPCASTWIFDLDNTLHDATPYVFPHINRSMTAYLQQHLGLDEIAANELRIRYWQRYGATLSGLIKHHGTDPGHFLWHTHQFPELPRMILRTPHLRHALKKLPGRKILYSNAPAHYATAVLKLLGIARLFEGVFALEDAHFSPKPETAGFLRMLKRYRLNPARCIMVEDSADNLATAKRLGMRTVWVGRASGTPAHVDMKIDNVAELPRAMSRL
jgi:putative hydrolase of the HAD superfamily